MIDSRVDRDQAWRLRIVGQPHWLTRGTQPDFHFRTHRHPFYVGGQRLDQNTVALVPDFRAVPWLRPRTAADRPLVTALLLELDPGEAEAIALALELHADLALLDERRGRPDRPTGWPYPTRAARGAG